MAVAAEHVLPGGGCLAATGRHRPLGYRCVAHALCAAGSLATAVRCWTPVAAAAAAVGHSCHRVLCALGWAWWVDH
eukprot:832317-Pelagomonas_calceolata.AAC.3